MNKFPNDFLWGVATSHFQIEGNPIEISARSSDWAAWTVLDGHIADRTTADQACEFYSRYSTDLDLLSELNLNALRISLNWPAICPEPITGKNPLPVNRAELDRYFQILAKAKAKGIKTFVTLFHFCLPTWLAERGGWNNRVAIDEFRTFTELVVEEYKDLVDYWITLNEPLAYAYQSYIAGGWPPGLKHDFHFAFMSLRNMLEAHGAAYHVIHEADPNASVSFTTHWRPFMARNPLSPADQMVANYRNQVFNHIFPNACQTGSLEFPFPFTLAELVKKISGPVPNVKDTMDYLAINYYTRDICEFKVGFPIDLFGVRSDVAKKALDGMGWESYPDGLYHLLTNDLAKYKKDLSGRIRPIFITENGYADVFPADLSEGDWSIDDGERAKYLHQHVEAIHRAIKDGANVKGYLHWSLLDNFEWAEGLRMRFGLVRVAYPTQERRLRKSARVYAEIAKNNAIDNKLPI
jgi:beta-glucosidase